MATVQRIRPYAITLKYDGTSATYWIDPRTGDLLWSFATKQRVDSSPVLVGERAFVGSSDGRMYAIDSRTGKKVWEYEAAGGFSSSPAVADGRLVIASDRGTIYCFGKKEGANDAR